MLGGQGEVVVGVVVVGEGIALAAEFVDHAVVVGVTACAAEHKMLKEVSKTRAVASLVARAHTVE